MQNINGQLPSFAEFLPPEAVGLIRSRVAGEYATVSAAGVPIDTPSYVFPDADLTTLDVGTGVAYPAKAERARRNPKVGMLIEGTAQQPVISIAGFAAVRDADIQANLDRYLAETIFTPNINPALVPWETTRQRLYYLSRIIVAIAPSHVRWWPNRAAMDNPPQEWRAALGAVFPSSDPPATGPVSKPPIWPQKAWPALAERAISSGLPAHLTLLDDAGFPLPIRVGDVRRDSQGFRMTTPNGAPWRHGKATLSFVGKEVFVGEAMPQGSTMVLCVERALPILPTVEDRGPIKTEVLAQFNGRLYAEMKRRGQPLPQAPRSPPQPTEGALYRSAASMALDPRNVGTAVS